MKLTRHALRRCRQRGVSLRRFAAFLDYADLEKPIGGNCVLIQVSNRTADLLPGGERFRRLAGIVSHNTGEVVTLMPLAGSRGARRYRAGWRAA